MKTLSMVLVFCLFLFTVTIQAQNAPVTVAGNIADCKADVTVPVKVAHFIDIGAISLTLDYDYGILQATGATPNSYLPGFTVNTAIPGRIILGWIGNYGVTLPDSTVIVEITFSGWTGVGTDLIWYDNGISCEYAKYDGGAQNVLNDSPTSTYYKNGHISYREGPITVAPIYNAIPYQENCIPITVSQFSNIGAISLTLDYNPAKLTYKSINSDNIPIGWSLSGVAANPGRLVIGGMKPGSGPGLTLNDGDTLLNICFDFLVCDTTNLKWWDGNAIACEYAEAENLTPLCDIPQSKFYVNGRIYNAPVANADVNTTNEDVPVSGDVSINDIEACVGGNEWSLVGPYGGATLGTVIMNPDGTYTYTPNPNANGTDVFTYQVCDDNSLCDEATVTITINPVDEPDITPNITLEPNVVHGTAHFDIIIKVTELNDAPTNGLITIHVPIDTRWVLDPAFDKTATMIGTNPVDNADWNYSSDAIYHIFTSNEVISPKGISQFGFHALWNAGSSTGHANVTSQITSWSGGENKDNNNSDAEIIDYFIY